MKLERALIGMSGGVDSSVAAHLMQQTHVCTGATMELFGDASESIADARAVAEKLGIDFMTMDLRKEFDEKVIQSFIAAYEAGLTPNPCIRCNHTLKFGILLDKALEAGFSCIATGHYAQIRQDTATGRYLMYRAKDQKKDQTYFLAGLNQHQLAHTHFPLGGLSKEEARAIAEENGFINARKRDSQDICFVPDGDYVAFMQRHTRKTYSHGNYLDLDGKILGKHKGAVCYTIGQRKGLGIALGAPAYVCRKDMHNNTVTLGPNEVLFSNALRAKEFNWIPFPALSEPMSVTAKIRHSQFDQPATVYPEEDGSVRVVFDQPQRAISPGQAVVLYSGDLVIGGGTIAQVL
jgi:tRNA-specific 2-thiouridylase